MYKTFTSLKRTWQRNKQRAEKQHLASKSFRSWILEDIQINNNVIPPTVLKQNMTRQRMPERNLLMKRRLNKSLVLVFNLTLVRGTLKGTMASTVAVALVNNNALDAWVGELMELKPTFIHTTNQHRFWHTNHAKQHMRGTYRDDKAACSTLAVSLKRWDVEVGTDKRARQRNKGMAENRTNVFSLSSLPI